MASPVIESMGVALRRPVVAGVVLLVVYGALSLLMDPHGYLGTDTGAKVATLEMMKRDHTADPNVGYWAAEWDPDGRLHPLYQSFRRDDGGWVAVSTLPMLELARPLYNLGGYRATLLLPMLGAVGAAFGARAVARRIGAVDDGWSAFWVVGLASPMAIYALDFWEHSIGVACMVGATALLLDVVEGRGRAPALWAGVLLGISAVLRNETFVYALVAVAAACLVTWGRSGAVTRALRAGVLTVVGFGGPWFANVALEGAVGASPAATRMVRATGTAEGGGSDLGLRAREGMQTLFGMNRGALGESVLLGLVIVLLLLVALRADLRTDRRFAVVCMTAAAAVYVLALSDGLRFVPGLFVAFPMAVGGIVALVRRPGSRLIAGVAIGALPLVYLFQYTGGAAPQWGGRYTLPSAVLLGVVGLVGWGPQLPVIVRGLGVISLGVTAFGVSWLGVRSHGVDRFFRDVTEQAAPVVISRNPFLIREGGAVSLGRRWLSVSDEAGFEAAVRIARRMGEQRVSVLEWGAAAPPASELPAGLREVRRSQLAFVDVPVGLVTYEITG